MTQESCCIIINIRFTDTISSYVADSKVTGNHWVCICSRFEPNLWLYADTLGCSLLENLFQYLGPLKDTVQKVYILSYTEDACLHAAHPHSFRSNKYRTESCTKYVPFQSTDMNICGVATIMSAIVLTNDVLFSHIMKNSSLPRSFSWLKAFDSYSDFIRKTFIVWYIKEMIDLSLLKMEPSGKQVCTTFPYVWQFVYLFLFFFFHFCIIAGSLLQSAVATMLGVMICCVVRQCYFQVIFMDHNYCFHTFI